MLRISVSKVAVCLLVLMPALLAADTFKVNITRETHLGAAMIPAGEYRVTVDGNTAEFRKGKETYTAPVTQETLDTSARHGYVRYNDSDNRITEVVVRGTKLCLRF